MNMGDSMIGVMVGQAVGDLGDKWGFWYKEEVCRASSQHSRSTLEQSTESPNAPVGPCDELQLI